MATYALVRDLMFGSKITAAARAVGTQVKMIRSTDALAAEESPAGSRLIADLNVAGNLQAAIDWKTKTAGSVIGFISHVDGDGIAQARAMNVDRVMSNGGFSANLESILREQA